MTSAPGPALLLVAPPFSGHLNPLLTLARGLREHGYDPRFATGAAKVDLLRHHGFVADAVLARDPGALERIAETSGPVRSNPVLLARQLAANLALLPGLRSELEALVDRDGHRLVLADFTAPVAGWVAQSRGLPWVTVMPTPFVLETQTGTPAYCGGWGPPRHAGHRARDALGRTATRAMKLTMQRMMASRLAAAGSRVYRDDGSEAAYSPHAILALGMLELELPRDWPPQVDFIGPVTATPEPWPTPPVLPPGRLVLVTLGTHLGWAKHTLVDAVTRLSSAFPEHRFLVTLGDASRAAPEPTAVLGRVHVYAHLPYDDVLPRCDAVIHHGGAGIVYSAVRAGVPAVVVPHDYDQFDFAARVEAAEAGIRAKRIDARSTRRALAAVLELDRTPLRALAASAAGYDPVAATVRAVGRALEDAGPVSGSGAGRSGCD